MLDLTSENLEAILKHYAAGKAVSRVQNFIHTPAAEEGTNYVSDTIRVQMNVVKGDGSISKLSIVIKLSPMTEARRQFVMDKSAFSREIKMYKEILPNMLTVQHAFGDFSEQLWANCLAVNYYECIILEDLLKLDYRMLDKATMLDFDHALLAICGLAKFHALSVVLKENFMLDPKNFSEYWFCSLQKSMESRFSSNLKSLSFVMKSSWGKEWYSMADDIEQLSDVVVQKMEDVCRRDDSSFNVLIHGDLWKCNFLFKYCPFTGKPIGIRFMDFQTVYYGSYAMDLIFLMNTSVSNKVKTESLEALLKAYHKTLVKNLEKFKSRSTLIPTLDQVKMEIKKKEFFGAAICCCVMNFIMAESGDQVDFEMFREDRCPDNHLKTFYSKSYTEAMQAVLKPFLGTDLFKRNL